MFHSFSSFDGVLDGEEFIRQEVTYLFLHPICAQKNALRLASSDRKVIAGQNEDYPIWIYVADGLEEEEIEKTAKELCAATLDRKILTVVSHPLMAEAFAVERCKAQRGRYYGTMSLNAYECRHFIHPRPAGEYMVKANQKDFPLVKKYLSDFMFWAMGAPLDEKSMEPMAKELIEGGGLYFLYEGDRAVSMGNFACMAPRHAKINYIYTPEEDRGKGYASYLTGCLCEMIFSRGFTPMLYADVNNPTSNGIYRKLGFELKGRVDEITLD